MALRGAKILHDHGPRLRRQRLLTEADTPQLWAILSEATLRQQIGGAEVMRGQLQRLAEASKLDNVTLQMLPFAAGAHSGVNGSFTTLTTSDLSVVVVENLTRGTAAVNRSTCGSGFCRVGL